jgi:hypothetical protein
MVEKIKPFIQHNRRWMIKKILADYFRAKNMFTNMDRENQSGLSPDFENLKKLSDILYAAKEDLHLLFKKVGDPRGLRFEAGEKLTPSSREIDFINNVGLLYHKAMVARELKYLLEHYQVARTDHVASRTSLETYMERIRSLFEEGIAVVKDLLRDYGDNTVLLYYIANNDHYVQYALGEPIDKLLAIMENSHRVDQAYLQVGRYCLESGWMEPARKMLSNALRVNPKNRTAQRLLDEIL